MECVLKAEKFVETIKAEDKLLRFRKFLKEAKTLFDIADLFRRATRFVKNLKVDYEKFEGKLLLAMVNDESIIFFTETLTIAFMVYKNDVIVRISGV